MKFLAFFFCAAAIAAEPDWKALDTYAVDLLQRYLRIRSINPPADTREGAEFLKAEFAKHGIEAKLYHSGPENQTNLLVRIAGKNRAKKPILLLNHIDVVPVDPKQWSVDPFAAVLKDGWIWGRGALDMKGIAVQQITALIAMKQAGIQPQRDILLFASADEETGGHRGIQWMLANHPKEIDAEFILDEGGVVSRDLLSPDKLVFGVAVGEKQILWLKMTAKGTAAHGSQPIPENANLMLMEALQKALAMPATSASGKQDLVKEMQSSIGTLARNKFTNAIQGNTMTVTSLRSGVGDPPKANVIPSIAEATIDCRLLPGVNADEFLSEIKARVNHPAITITKLNTSPDSGISNSKTPLFEAIRKAAITHYPGAVVTPMLIPYGTDSSHARIKGYTAYGLNPMLLDAATMATMHSDGERIPVDSFLKGIRIFYDVLRSDF
jgi:acetylornithine deacetylase/succinyl-diaminopimelate desuccinylase-like protein